MKPAVFLDRDGTLIRERDGFLTRVDQLELVPGAASAVKRLNDAGFLVVLVTNQSALARGLLDERGLSLIHAELESRLEREGAHLDAIHFCPHHPEAVVPSLRQACECRKPRAGMHARAILELGIDPARAFLVGDDVRDVALELPAGSPLRGMRPILVRTGKGALAEARARERLGASLVVVDDLPHAIDCVLEATRDLRTS